MTNRNLFGLSCTLLMAMGLIANVQAQDKKDDELLKIYRATPTKVNDLKHTKLDVQFDYKKCYLYGKEWLTLKPHFYSTDSLRLNAKGMDIKNISIVKNDKTLEPLKYTYDNMELNIKLDRKYEASETYTIYIAYTAKPNELKVKGSAAINDAKGLYFINPDSSIKGKPVQIWTQGETEGSSVWFPTIDNPSQKTTSEISMTVPSKYVSLSNGKLVSQKPNPNGTRTDTWKMDLPHSPYLFMMAVGDFKIYKDKWRDKEVNYYLEPKYAPYAKDIFGLTPEMMEFYSKKLGVDYPWNKYSQIVVRDYVSGAMENTSATLHGDYVQATKRQLIDGSPGESTIAHELFHQWFGDYVTAESWSNLTVNESFANFSEVLWAEHKYGKDAGDETNFKDMRSYLSQPDAATKNLVRFHYADKEEVFDVVTYQKGGRILNMLRNYLGEDAFFKGLNTYLKQNAFKNGEAQQLRLAFEEVSGKDLNWFFNQWYYNSGHPILSINYKWDEASKTQTVSLKQSQAGDAFILPMAIDIYNGKEKERHMVWMNDKSADFTFKLNAKPDLVNVDGDKVLLAEKTDNKTLEEYVFQYFNAGLFLDRYEAISAAAMKQNDPGARRVLIAALQDRYETLRTKAITALKMDNADIRTAALPVLQRIIENDPKTLVRAAAINVLAKLNNPSYLPLFKKALDSQSYAVQASALNGISQLDGAEALKLAKGLEKDTYGSLTDAIIRVYSSKGSEAELPFVVDKFNSGGVQQKFDLMGGYIGILKNVNTSTSVETGVTEFKKFAILYKQFGVDKPIIQQLQTLESAKATKAAESSSSLKDQLTSQAGFIRKAIEEIQSSGQ